MIHDIDLLTLCANLPTMLNSRSQLIKLSLNLDPLDKREVLLTDEGKKLILRSPN